MLFIIKCLTYCACCDWSVWVHYCSTKHAAYVTRVLYRYNASCLHHVRAHTISLAFYKRSKKLHPPALLSYISTWEFLRTLEKCEKHSAAPRASLYTSFVFLKIPACLYNSTMHSDAFFYFFNKMCQTKSQVLCFKGKVKYFRWYWVKHMK